MFRHGVCARRSSVGISPSVVLLATVFDKVGFWKETATNVEDLTAHLPRASPSHQVERVVADLERRLDLSRVLFANRDDTETEGKCSKWAFLLYTQMEDQMRLVRDLPPPSAEWAQLCRIHLKLRNQRPPWLRYGDLAIRAFLYESPKMENTEELNRLHKIAHSLYPSLPRYDPQTHRDDIQSVFIDLPLRTYEKYVNSQFGLLMNLSRLLTDNDVKRLHGNIKAGLDSTHDPRDVPTQDMESRGYFTVRASRVLPNNDVEAQGWPTHLLTFAEATTQ